MRPTIGIIATALLVAAPTIGRASDSSAAVYYYNRAGATLGDLDRDSAYCLAQYHGHSASVPATGVGRTSSAAAGNAVLAGVFAGVIGLAMENASRKHFVDECLLIAGWRHVAVSSADADALRRAIRADRSAALGPLVGAATVPASHVARQWQNSYAQPHIVKKDAQ